jgi:nucleoside-diphosphate-sugar epimerase
MTTRNTIVVFGGTGFIGTHFAQQCLQNGQAQKIVLVDHNPPRKAPYTRVLQEALSAGSVEFLSWDVRKPIPVNLIPRKIDLICNFAAVHREPGHHPREYYETNISGAENVCAWAQTVGCGKMVFTSSISPYGPSEEMKDEDTLPVPETPYGGSKLVAEKIHVAWQAASPQHRLVIVRPGVVFGPGEGGNVTRLLRSLIKGYFVYLGNRETRKAGLYVKELVRIIEFGLTYQEETGTPIVLLNAGMNPPPRMEDFVVAIRKVAEVKREPISIPRAALLGVSYPIDAVARTFGIKQPVSPVRVRKLFRPTYVVPKRLVQLGYDWKYSLESAFVDWKAENPTDFVP